MRISTKQIGEEFVQSHIEGNPATLKQLAMKHGRNYEALRKAAAKGKWSNRAAVASAERDSAVAVKMRQQNALTACLLQQEVETEVQVRRRHGRLARCLQEAALQRLVAITPDELTPKLAIEMLRIGIEVEREALGLGDVAPNLHDDSEDKLRLREAVEAAEEMLSRHFPARGLKPAPNDSNSPHVNHTHVNAEEIGSHCNQLQ